ncbi:MAG: LuxR C-terminal-related transcriptional regulator [Spirochaetota bacterium]
MNILSLLNIIIFISFVYFGIYILRFNYKSITHRLFFLLCLTFSIWALFASFAYSSNDKDNVFFWYKASIPFVFLFLSVNTHFTFELTGKKLNKCFIPVIYLQAVILTIITITSSTLYSDCFLYEGRWEFIITPDTFGFIFYIIIININAGTVIYLLASWRKNTRLQKIKKQAGLILIFYFITMSVACLLDIVFPALKYYDPPNSGPTILLFYITGLWYSMVKYKFLVFQPSMAADKIISNIQEIVILLSPDFRIIEANNKFIELMDNNLSKEALKNKNYSEIVSENNYLNIELHNLAEKQIKSFDCKIEYMAKPDNIFTDSYFTGITDNFGDLTGILVISRENKGIKEFRKKYKLTHKQFDIITLSLTGLSNIEIGKKLNLAERTIETHLYNIYHKLNINNKIELLNKAREYNLI